MSTVTENEAAGTLTFHQALVQAEAQARSTLDVGLHERLSAATSLVKDGKVFQTSTGLWQVDSSTNGLTYSVNGTCQCEDHHFNKPRYCKHQLAMFLAQRVLSLMRQPAPPVVPELADAAPAAPAVPLPEAPASVNVHITIAGRQVQLTLRDSDEARLLQRLAAVLQQYPLPEPAKASSQAPQGQAEGWCAIHETALHLHHSKDGRSWYSHRLSEGGFCKGHKGR